MTRHLRTPRTAGVDLRILSSPEVQEDASDMLLEPIARIKGCYAEIIDRNVVMLPYAGHHIRGRDGSLRGNRKSKPRQGKPER